MWFPSKSCIQLDCSFSVIIQWYPLLRWLNFIRQQLYGHIPYAFKTSGYILSVPGALFTLSESITDEISGISGHLTLKWACSTNKGFLFLSLLLYGLRSCSFGSSFFDFGARAAGWVSRYALWQSIWILQILALFLKCSAESRLRGTKGTKLRKIVCEVVC